MKLTSTRYTKLTLKLRNLLIYMVKQDNDVKATKYLNRLNRVLAIARNRNLSNGMLGMPWVNTSLVEVKTMIIKKGL